MQMDRFKPREVGAKSPSRQQSIHGGKSCSRQESAGPAETLSEWRVIRRGPNQWQPQFGKTTTVPGMI